MAYIAKELDDNRTFIQGTFLTNINNIQTNLLLDQKYLGSGIQAIANRRVEGSNFMAESATSGQGNLSTVLSNLAEIQVLPQKVIGNQVSTLAWDRSYMITNNKAFAARQRTQTGPTPGGANVGTGTVYVLAKDEDGYPLDAAPNGLTDTITITCTQDQQGGAILNQEPFTFEGQGFYDLLDYYQAGFGSGVLDVQNAQNSDNSTGYLANPSFGSFSGSVGTVNGNVAVGTPTAITKWNVLQGTLGTDFYIDQTNYFTAAQYEGTSPGSLMLMCLNTCEIYQRPSDSKLTLPTATPTFFAFRWRCDANATPAVGTLTCYVGGKSLVISVSGQTGWQTAVVDQLTIGAYTYLEKTCYLKNYNTQLTHGGGHPLTGLAVSFLWASSTGGTAQLNIDDINWFPMNVPGYGQNPLPGASGGSSGWITPMVVLAGATPFQAADYFTLAFGETGAKIQRMHARWTGPIASLYGSTDGTASTGTPIYSFPGLPAAPASAPTNTTSSGALTGVYKYVYTNVDRWGIESGPSATLTTSSLSSNDVLLAGIVAGTASYVATRNIYRTKSGGTTFYFLHTLADNSTTTYTDNAADGTITVQMSARVLAGITQADV
jgi:hypothetical protein